MYVPHLIGFLAAAATTIATEQQPIGPAWSSGSTPSPPPYRDDLLSLHKSLVSIPSTTGTEHAVGNFLVDYLAARSYTTQRQPLPPLNNTPPGADRFNVLAWPGPNPDPDPRPRVLITSHVDVVPPHIRYRIDDSASGPGPTPASAAAAAWTPRLAWRRR